MGATSLIRTLGLDLTQITTIDGVLGIALAILGAGVGIWFTRVFWIDQISGKAKPLFDRIMAGVAFLLTGSIPAGIQAFTSGGGSFAMAMSGLVLGAGGGLLLGYFLPSRVFADQVFSLGLAIRSSMGGGQATHQEVFAFGSKFGLAEAQEMLGMDKLAFESKYALGATDLSDALGRIDPIESRVVLEALTGVPITQIARDYAMTPRKVCDSLLLVLA